MVVKICDISKGVRLQGPNFIPLGSQNPQLTFQGPIVTAPLVGIILVKQDSISVIPIAIQVQNCDLELFNGI